MTTSPALARAHARIDAAYSALEALGNFVVRAAQKEFSKAVATCLAEGRPLVAEAPTGTGKTLGYLVGALAFQEASGSATPIVVSTATKALQQQLIDNDIPRLVRIGLIGAKQVGLAKGKGNYLCLNEAETVQQTLLKNESSPEDVYLDNAAAALDPEDVAEIVAVYDKGEWNGDFDQYPGVLPGSTRAIAVSQDTCLGRHRCPVAERCAYFKARDELGRSRLIVANHTLVLLELWARAMESETSLSMALSQMYLVFDEGHHLPQQAIAVGSTECNLSQLMLELPKVTGMERLVKGSPELARLLSARWLTAASYDRTAVTTALKELMATLAEVTVDAESHQARFIRGVVPPDIRAALAPASKVIEQLHVTASQTADVIRVAEISNKALLEKANEMQRRALDVKAATANFIRCNAQLHSPARLVKWLYHKEDSISLHASNLEAADVLRPTLWKLTEVVKGVVITSATLRDMGGFERFKSSTGLPDTAQFMALPYTFPYGKSRLIVAAMTATPKLAERRRYYAELDVALPKAVNRREGTLILFPSWAMFRQYAPKLKSWFGPGNVRLQGELPVKNLVADHKRAIDSGKGSILAGVATLAEGLDLPGAYCEHVVVLALPFAAPTDPVEQELADILGSKYFGERSLPDAMARLAQYVGRLLRRETDQGRITVFDRRLASTSYGRQMLRNLPPFEKVIEPVR